MKNMLINEKMLLIDSKYEINEKDISQWKNISIDDKISMIINTSGLASGQVKNMKISLSMKISMSMKNFNVNENLNANKNFNANEN